MPHQWPVKMRAVPEPPLRWLLCAWLRGFPSRLDDLVALAVAPIEILCSGLSVMKHSGTARLLPYLFVVTTTSLLFMAGCVGRRKPNVGSIALAQPSSPYAGSQACAKCHMD